MESCNEVKGLTYSVSILKSIGNTANSFVCTLVPPSFWATSLEITLDVNFSSIYTFC